MKYFIICPNSNSIPENDPVEITKILSFLFCGSYIRRVKTINNQKRIYSKCKKLHHIQTIAYLLLNGADPIINNNFPIKWAITHGNDHIIDLFINRGADINIGLMTAIIHGNIHLVKFFINRGANPSANNYHSIKCAIIAGRIDIIRLIIDYGNGIDLSDKKLLLMETAVNTCDDEIMKLLLGYGAIITIKSIILAIQHNSMSMIRVLLDNCSESLDPALISACESDNFFMAKILIEYGANSSAQSDAPLKLAAKYGFDKICQLLLENGANPTCSYNEPLIAAAEGSHISVAKILLEAGANVGEPEQLPLRYASKNGHKLMVQFLIANGADIFYMDCLPMRMAALNGMDDVVKLLIENGSDPNAIDGWALITSVIFDHYHVAKVLIDKGADVTLSDNSAIKVAVDKNNEEMIKLLIENGAIYNN